METNAKKSHYLVLGSYLIIILIMIVASLFASHLERKLQQAITQLEQKTLLKDQVENLYQHARNRSVLLFRLVNSRDIFEKDQFNMQLSAEASAMILIVDSLGQQATSPITQNHLQNLLSEFEQNYRKQSQVVTLAFEEEYELASSLLVFDTLPHQEGALSIFRQLKSHYHQQINRQQQEVNHLITQIKNYWSGVLGLVLLLLLISARTTFLKLRKADRIQQEFKQKLTQQVNERTQELVLDSSILHNIHEAFAITNQQGTIVKTNQPFENLIKDKPTSINKSIWHQLEQLFYGFESSKILNQLSQQDHFRQEVLLQQDEDIHFLIDIFRNNDPRLDHQHLCFLLTDISHFKATQNELEDLANYDNVTGLANRHLFQNTLQTWIKDQYVFSVFFVDLDNFKWINDTQGHAEGDHVLAQVATLLARLIPDQTQNLVARLGGDEFALLCRNLDERAIATLANAMIQGVYQLYQGINPSKTLGCSIGIAHYPRDGQSREDLMRHADYAMYKAKEQGKNRYCLFSDDMNEQIHYLYDMEIQLHRALEKQEFYMVYQLQYQLNTLEVSGAETLIRWQSENRFISPAEFIPLAERFGLIQSIGRYVLNATLEQLNQWKQSCIAIPRVAINVSSAQLNGEGFVDDVKRQLQHYQIAPHQLELEITESLLMDHLSEDNKALQALQEKGLEIAIDDFGTGYSSLAYIKHLNVDRIKIDQGFIKDLEYNAESYSIVKTIITMGHSLGLKVIAEGIETINQLIILRDLGCDEGQGYLLAKPEKPENLSFDALTELNQISQKN
ncbi:EAL domain-containing protein [Thiomicrospira microaerophila]|uniref:putative bifunctional diguanylate cyclase/phosphodiesterase n=1 Tax=Thiomicrospira microaerophila TaxID=406020 RepID=UPI00200BBCB7|nr:EAL domain-containing protein [Thiomicrospira microaerophila]UQB42646.1 EAL domain-containing protein [Thiomicrospira microaerophila]